jgi:hypothetical protein
MDRFRAPVSLGGCPRAFARAVLVAIVFWVAGCAGVDQGVTGAVGPGPIPVAADAARPPQWGAGDEVPVAPPSSAPGQVLFDDPGSPPVLFSQNPDVLRAEVAAECRAAESGTPPQWLSSLVVALYLSVVDPAEATEALILGKCATVQDIVREMVARGGETVLAPVVERAHALSSPRSRGTIETAAADGLVKYAERNDLGIGPTRLARDHAMAYFPSLGPTVRIDEQNAPEPLYRQAIPGYGVYTFVMVGPGYERLPQIDQARHRELFRLIDTYAAVEGQGAAEPRPDAHVFLIPVDSELAHAPLFNQVAADLSDRMRRQLIDALSLRGETTLAGRLENGSGPFLVAGLDPDLIPRGSESYRLVVDLSGVGAEHLYAIVDAFDRGISPDIAGVPDSLIAIRDLLKVAGPGGPDDAAALANADQPWFFILGGAGDVGAGVLDARPMFGVDAFQKNEQPVPDRLGVAELKAGS